MFFFFSSLFSVLSCKCGLKSQYQPAHRTRNTFLNEISQKGNVVGRSHIHYRCDVAILEQSRTYQLQ
jgi:hypothetical protein